MEKKITFEFSGRDDSHCLQNGSLEKEGSAASCSFPPPTPVPKLSLTSRYTGVPSLLKNTKQPPVTDVWQLRKGEEPVPACRASFQNRNQGFHWKDKTWLTFHLWTLLHPMPPRLQVFPLSREQNQGRRPPSQKYYLHLERREVTGRGHSEWQGCGARPGRQILQMALDPRLLVKPLLKDPRGSRAIILHQS